MNSDKTQTHAGKIQVNLSRGNIDYVVRTTSEPIHNIKFKNEKLQKDSHLDEETRRQQR